MVVWTKVGVRKERCNLGTEHLVAVWASKIVHRGDGGEHYPYREDVNGEIVTAPVFRDAQGRRYETRYPADFCGSTRYFRRDSDGVRHFYGAPSERLAVDTNGRVIL